MYQKTTEKAASRQDGRRTPNRTGIPEPLKQRFEAASGMSFDDVRIHYNSGKPAELGAYAYTQGNQVYLSPGQERHLSHELGHVIQQKAGMVRPTAWRRGLPVNTDPGLERMADNPFRSWGGAFRQGPMEAAACIQGRWRRMNFTRRNCFICKMSFKDLTKEFSKDQKEELRQLLGQTRDITLLLLQGEPDAQGEPRWEIYMNGVRLRDDWQDMVMEQTGPAPQDEFHLTQSRMYPAVGDHLDTHVDYLRELNQTAANKPPLQEEQDEQPPGGAPPDYREEALKLRRTFQDEDRIMRREIERTWNNILHIEDSLTEVELPLLVEQIALYKAREYAEKQYTDACHAVLLLRAYGRTGRQPYRDAMERRAFWGNKRKNARDLLPGFREQARAELAQKLSNWAALLVPPSDNSGAGTDHQESSLQKTRRQLRESSLLVLPDGLPLAGVFPACDARCFPRDAHSLHFSDLRAHADSLIIKYRLSGADDGMLDRDVKCVCIMYLKENTGTESRFRPAFGISGFFKGKRDRMSTGMDAMGIPQTLLDPGIANKPAALLNYIYMCSILGLRKPSIQAMLSYLQSGAEYGDVENWTPVECAEPAIVMAIRNLWHVTSELVISFPFQGHLHLQPGGRDKTPIPKYTCARCAIAEYAFGAAVFDPEKGTRVKETEEGRETERYVGRKKVAMQVGLDRDKRGDKLSSEQYILNQEAEPFLSNQQPYQKQEVINFLAQTRDLGIYHMREEDLLTRLEREISELEQFLPLEAAPPAAEVPDRGVSPQAAVVIQIKFLEKLQSQLTSQPNMPQASQDLAARIKKLTKSLIMEAMHPGITQPATVPDATLARLSSLVASMTEQTGLLVSIVRFLAGIARSVGRFFTSWFW